MPEHKKTESQQIEIEEVNTKVDLCCSHSSLYGLKYISRIVLSILVLSFSFLQIARFPESDNSIYFSLISSILGYYLSIIDKNTI